MNALEKLSPADQEFVQYYLQSGNATQAARQAYGYASDDPSATTQGYRKTHHPEIQAVILNARGTWGTHAVGAMVRGLQSTNNDKAGILGVSVLKGLGHLQPDTSVNIVMNMPAEMRAEYEAELAASYELGLAAPSTPGGDTPTQAVTTPITRAPLIGLVDNLQEANDPKKGVAS